MEFILNIISPSKKQEFMGQTSSNSEIRAQQHSQEDNYKYPQSPSKSDQLPRMQANSLDIGNNLKANASIGEEKFGRILILRGAMQRDHRFVMTTLRESKSLVWGALARSHWCVKRTARMSMR